jgi:glycosyltransferase involved in cell wall biosynthesis
MRIALADLLFSWPPHGGADADLYHVADQLQKLGHEIHLFAARSGAVWERGDFDPAALPFPASRLEFDQLDGKETPRRFREAIDAWHPDAVFVCDGFLLKPDLILALAHYPLAVRFYAWECVCLRDILRFRDEQPCPHAYPRTPDTCRQCAAEFHGPAIRNGMVTAWLEEFHAAAAWRADWHDRFRNALAAARLAIVSNSAMQAEIALWCPDTRIVPGGVDPDRFPPAPRPEKEASDTKVIFMCGRGEDPLKGAPLLLEACEKLRHVRDDFVIRVTMPPQPDLPAWFAPQGWCGPEELRRLYREADICVAPSIWEEPFGLIALEAMSAARPVCASRTGGLRDIVVDGETGLLVERGSADALADALARLLDDTDLRRRMGEAGRRRVLEEYTWEAVAQRHYPPLLERLQAEEGNR